MTTERTETRSPRKGEIWAELGAKPPRFVKVVVAGDHLVKIGICSVEKVDGHWEFARNPHNRRFAPTRYAKRERFDGRPSGYNFVEDGK